MPDDAFDAVLRLVADGRLTAEEAGPILDALGAPTDPPTPTDDPRPAEAAPASPSGGPGRALRVEVTEHGRKVVNLRVPLALGRAALSRIPGLSEATADYIRELVESGVSGPIVAVDDGPDKGVRIVIE
jgi:hypothetical protein